ncbi:hypothetical protein CLV59_102554 [Chitinophaga dinghuensis]|uniref:Uncharacterized protein n=1 Tax=Chitinophaga dinghuensis TaxID=1539050 RepID=A0A327W8P7_9BACT|nr:hypothetical protein [Chitinophaga dinghuensis]RAJ85848.1 hypothetical protein CLV59_102554 [Chitinophaga dinghuensis]
MKRDGLYLSIPSPCKESWDEMVAVTDGRFCKSCQRTVMDFTQFTDEQLLAYFKGQKGAVCGRLRSEQLKRYLLPMRPQQRLIPVLLLTAGLMVLTGIAEAQQIKPQPTITYKLYGIKSTNCKPVNTDSISPVNQNVTVPATTDDIPYTGAVVVEYEVKPVKSVNKRPKRKSSH